jgi:hypothetical protein
MPLIADTAIAPESFTCPAFYPDEDSAPWLGFLSVGVSRCFHASSALDLMVITDAAPGKDTQDS